VPGEQGITKTTDKAMAPAPQKTALVTGAARGIGEGVPSCGLRCPRSINARHDRSSEIGHADFHQTTCMGRQLIIAVLADRKMVAQAMRVCL
jgi:hypothetical protein